MQGPPIYIYIYIYIVILGKWRLADSWSVSIPSYEGHHSVRCYLITKDIGVQILGNVLLTKIRAQVWLMIYSILAPGQQAWLTIYRVSAAWPKMGPRFDWWFTAFWLLDNKLDWWFICRVSAAWPKLRPTIDWWFTAFWLPDTFC